LADIKEIKRLRGGDLQVAAQANGQIDAEIGQKDHFRMETNLHHHGVTSSEGGENTIPDGNGLMPANHFQMDTNQSGGFISC